MNIRRNTLRAFTLLEVILALAMAAMVVATLYTSMQIAFASQKTVAAALEPVQAMHTAFDLIGRDLEAALPPAGTLAGALIGTDALGGNGVDGDSISFYSASNIVRLEHNASTLGLSSSGSSTGSSSGSSASGSRSASGSKSSMGSPASQSGGSSGGALDLSGNLAASTPKTVTSDIQQISIALTEPTEEGQTVDLARSSTLNLLSPEVVTPSTQTLIKDVRMVKWRYFDGSEWLDEYDSGTQDNVLPMAIELTIEAGDGNGGTYKLSKIFQMPCAIGAGDQGTKVVK